MLDLGLEFLNWAKGKDLAEIYYEDRSKNPPAIVHITFKPQSSINANSSHEARHVYVHSPSIGKIVYTKDVALGKNIQAGDHLGVIEGVGEKVEIINQTAGVIREIAVSNNSSVGYAQALLIVEIV